MNKFLTAISVFFVVAASSQNCTNLGQNPTTALAVCGSTTFKQTSVAICGTRRIPAPCTAPGVIFEDKNPYWYKFTCFKAGTLGFEIVPSNLSDDYDWQVFDITLQDPNNVYTDKTMFVACNWSGEGGKTGANASGTSVIVCNGAGQPLFSKMPDLLVGREYLLLVSHYSNSQSGYSLSFGGGTASITDSTASSLLSSRPSCDGKNIFIKLTKNMKCTSLAADGSDFSISSATHKIVAARGVNCNSGLDMDSIVLTLDAPLPPGNYAITTKKGTDSNTLLDNCEAPMSEGINTSFQLKSLQPTPFDSITKVGCAPNQLQAVFRKPLVCASVAPDGSDFTIDSAAGVTITAATANCTSTTTTVVTLTLSAPIKKQGNYRVTLVKGFDGNTILEECLQEMPAGASVIVTTFDTVRSTIVQTIAYGCKADTVYFSNPGGNSINSWNWNFNDRATSTLQNPAYVYTQFGAQQVKLTVSNGVCTDSTTATFLLDNKLKANFSAPSIICPPNAALFKDSSIGKVVSYQWDFGNGATSTIKDPPAQLYAALSRSQSYNIKLVVKNDRNCYDTAVKPISVMNSCFIAVATAFTPNGDGLNDYLYPINALKTNNLLFRVYNRYGQLVFETRNIDKKWDGTIKGLPQSSGTYVWTLQYVDADTGEAVFKKGTSVLIR